MEKALDFQTKDLNCDCREWITFPQKDEYVQEKPKTPKVKEIHDCEKLQVWQEGLKRFYLLK